MTDCLFIPHEIVCRLVGGFEYQQPDLRHRGSSHATLDQAD
jgi:hypothetical protein